VITGAVRERRIELMGMSVDVLTQRQAVEHVVAGDGGVIVTPNLDHLRRYGRSDAVRRFYAGADLVLADGMPLVWASRVAGTPLPERVAGSTMIWELSQAAAATGRPIYLLGGNPGAADDAAATLVERYPGLRVAGTACPPHGFENDPAQIEAIARALTESGPGIVFVGLPLDKQITLIEPLRERFPRIWFMGVGISFSFISGEVVRAPVWMQRLGVEWIHRLVQEPRRLARRYLLEGLPLAARLLAGALVTRMRRRAS
jgi:N-acetylglucosaminyldiphosphoundecaprenol N-acetyl-beta-D-mannosaminyltransferase